MKRLQYGCQQKLVNDFKMILLCFSTSSFIQQGAIWLFVRWCQYCQYIPLMVSLIVPLLLLVQDVQNEIQHDFSRHLILLALHEHHMMPMELSIALQHRLGQDNWNNVQHNFLHHVMQLMLMPVSHDANSVINGTIPFLRSRWSKSNFLDMWYLWHHHQHHVMPMASLMALLYLFGNTVNWNDMQHDFFVHLMHMVPALEPCDADHIINGTTAFVSSRLSKWDATWLLIMWCHWYLC